MSTYEVPLTASPQTFSILLAGINYQLTLRYAEAPEGGWLIDVADNAGNNVLCGVPLVTGHDLLGQYKYLALGGLLYVQTDGDIDAIPTFDGLGTQSHLYFVVS
jgi:hypothetical protein